MATFERALDAWYAEQNYYNSSNPVFSETTGHYTQFVWHSTRELGCAIGYCPNGVRVGSSTWQGERRFRIHAVCLQTRVHVLGGSSSMHDF